MRPGNPAGPRVAKERAQPILPPMHIGFRTSGGRGEYELVGEHGGIHASDTPGWTLYWSIPGIGRRGSNLWIDPGLSGKARLRAFVRNWPQIGRQIAGILLMPSPVRTRSSTLAEGTPVLVEKGYWLHKIGFRIDSQFDTTSQEIEIHPAYVEIRNGSESEIIGFAKRWERIQAVHQRYRELPNDLADAIASHIQSFQHEAIGDATIKGSERLYSLMGNQGSDVRDALDMLESRIGVPPSVKLDLPAVEEIEEDDVEIRILSASDMRLSMTRGHSARIFSQEVRRLYDHTCAFCGLRLPTEPNVLSGVDAAHILAWSSYDLDIVSNGICLCKNHHWAFDQAVLAVRYSHLGYYIEGTPRLALYNQYTQQEIRRVIGEIPESRLPENRDHRPSPRYLHKLYSDIAFSRLS